MPACATQGTIADRPTICNLFLPVPDTDFRDFLAEVEDLARFSPVLAYNCCRSILLRQRQREELERAA